LQNKPIIVNFAFMSKNLKNPISVLFGAVLQEMRKKYSTQTDEIALKLGISTSAYRMIESGNSNLNTSKIIHLLEISAFHSFRYDKVAKLLIGAQVLEPQRDEKESMVKTIQSLCVIDDEFSTLFNYDNYQLKELFSNEDLLDEFYSDQLIVDATRKFIESAINLNASKLKKMLEEIKAKSLCILQPVLNGTLDQFAKSIDDLEDMNSLQSRLVKWEREVDELREIQLGYLKHNALVWRNNHHFIYQYGIFHKHENLADRELLEKFQDNLTQLWASQFIESNYILVSKSKSEIQGSVAKFKEILKEVYTEKILINDKSKTFNEGLKKLKIGIVSPASHMVELMGVKEKKNELWLYQEEVYYYAFKTEFIPSVKGADLPEFVILTNGETKAKFEQFKQLLNEIDFITIKT